MNSSCLRVSDQLPSAVSSHVKLLAQQSIEERGQFLLAISGGSLPKNLLPLLSDDSVEWDKWKIFFVDERYVPLDHPDSNYFGAKPFLAKVSHHNVFPIDPSLSLEECAQRYQQILQEETNFDLDLVLLGMGEDGHTASLFPGHELLQEKVRFIAPIEDSPKPPPRRITMTFPLINRARHIAFVAGGAGKQDPLFWIFSEKRPGIPSGIVLDSRPDSIFFVDKSATAKL